MTSSEGWSQTMKTEQLTKKRNRTYIILGILIILHVCFAICLGLQKVDYHTDERLTFGLANNTVQGVEIETGKTYQGFELFNDYLSVKENERFDYKGVWENQAKDVHPPFYYVIIHTICSLFPGQYSKWFGIAPNIIFMILADIMLFKLAQCLLKNNGIALVAVMAMGVTMLNMNMVIFIRMYAMMAVSVIGIALVFTKYFNRVKDRKFYIGCYLFAVCGTMTQYYYLIYLFFLCFFMGLHMLFQKKWKEIIKFILVFAIAGISCVVIFHSMIWQIFGGSGRGKEAFAAAKTLKNYGKYLKKYFMILNHNIFGGCLRYLMIVLVLLSIGILVKKGGKYCLRRIASMPVLLLATGILYVCVIAKVAPYRTDRYVMPVGWIFVLFTVWYLYKGIRLVFGVTKTGWLNAGILILNMVFMVGCLNIAKWDYRYTYQNKNEIFDIVEKYKDYSVIYAYIYEYRIPCNAEELRSFKEYAFITSQNMAEFIPETSDHGIILYVDSEYNQEEIINAIKQKNHYLEKSTFLFESGYANVYCLE